MNENQFPTIHLNVFTGGIVSGHIQVDFVLESQIDHCDGADILDLAQGKEGFSTLPVMKAEAELLGEVALQGDEIKPVTADEDRVVLQLHGRVLAWRCDDEAFLVVTL